MDRYLFMRRFVVFGRGGGHWLIDIQRVCFMFQFKPDNFLLFIITIHYSTQVFIICYDSHSLCCSVKRLYHSLNDYEDSGLFGLMFLFFFMIAYIHTLLLNLIVRFHKNFVVAFVYDLIFYVWSSYLFSFFRILVRFWAMIIMVLFILFWEDFSLLFDTLDCFTLDRLLSLPENSLPLSSLTGVILRCGTNQSRCCKRNFVLFLQRDAFRELLVPPREPD